MVAQRTYRYRKVFKNFIYVAIVFSIIAVLCLDVYLIMNYPIYDMSQQLISSLVVLVVSVGLLQFRATMDWNRRQLAMSESARIVKSIKDATFELNKLFFDITSRSTIKLVKPTTYSSMFGASDEAFDVYYLHLIMCEYEVVDENGDQIAKFKEIDPNVDKPSKKLTEDGSKVRSLIITILDNLESLAIGIYHNTIDEDIIKEGFLLGVERNYCKYIKYIQHQRDHHNAKNVFTAFEALAKAWKTTDEKQKRDKT